MRLRNILGLTLLLAVALGLGYTGWRLHRSGQSEVCRVCGRPVHADMRTVAIVGGTREVFCCPTCALSAGAQSHEAVRFVQLSDFQSGRPLLPENAFAVEGSDVVPCVRDHQMLGPNRQPVPMEYDRCSPSIIAFASEAAAEQFLREHGGKLATFLELTAH